MPDRPEAGGFIPLATRENVDGSASSSRSSVDLDIEDPSPPTSKLTRLNGIALVVSLQIGSGIFIAPSHVSQYVTSPGWGLAVWFLGGLLVWTGAASFIELGLRIPYNGGMQEYLQRTYGDVMGFLFTWTWVAITKPATNAIIATIFADYLTRPFVSGPAAPAVVLKAVALSCVLGITWVNGLGTTAGAKVANGFLVLKLLALGSIAAIGATYFITGKGEGVPATEGGWFGTTTDLQSVGAWTWIGNFGIALFGALYCYGGWETVGFVLGDMKDPEGDLSTVINGSMTTVIIGFFLMNAALYICLPMSVVRGSSTVAVEFARRTLGNWGGFLYSIAVSISAAGALNSNTFATAILAVTASERGYFPDVLANTHCAGAKDEEEYLDETMKWAPTLLSSPIKWFAEVTKGLRWQRSVPIFALVMNGLITSLYVMTGSFNGLVTFIGLAEYSFFFASVIGLLILRRRDKHYPPTVTYRTWAGNPIIFAVVSGLLLLRVLISQPTQAMGVVLVVVVGLAVFYFRRGRGMVGIAGGGSAPVR